MTGAAGVRVALVTCREVPDLDPDTRLLMAPLEARGAIARAAVWDDPSVDWGSFDLAVVRSCWDYPLRRAEFLAWAHRVPRLANPAHVLEWNTDKRYLQQLAARGAPVVPTRWLTPSEQWNVPTGGEWVVKPSVSLASLDTGRYRLADTAELRLAVEHVQRLHRAGRTVMVQPYLGAVDAIGETSFVYIGGVFSHAVRRAAALSTPDTGLDRRFAPGGGLRPRLIPIDAATKALADKVLVASVTSPDSLLYARVDLLPGDDGNPLLIEVELTEPQLFFGLVKGSAERMAGAIVAHAQRHGHKARQHA